MEKNKKITIVLGAIVCLVLIAGVVFYILNMKDESDIVVPPEQVTELPTLDVKNMTYDVDGDIFTLKNGTAEKDGAPGSLTKNTLSIFGEPVYGDLDLDGDADAAIWLVNDSGGTGKFYYGLLDINTGTSYKPTNAMFLGDRIAPQSLNIEDGHAVYNFAQRKENDPMTAEPTIGKSVWVYYDKNSGEIGELVKDFEGEADPSKMTLTMKTWNWISATYPDGEKILPKIADKFTITFKKDNTFSLATDCNSMGGSFTTTKDKKITFSNIFSTKMYCEGSQEDKFREIFEKADNYYFTSKGELIFGFKGGSGIAIFR